MKTYRYIVEERHGLPAFIITIKACSPTHAAQIATQIGFTLHLLLTTIEDQDDGAI